ncbi:hypothetical protein K505DRAFT_290765 [Melanomma pulvis-pyrius CBS 109.77]|uniref:Uncharacterized protein n=1 Tax=Melanomma pulvis-pyrius CBS 109.77 TaxID=1314802 RepID=A0A6A6WP87_9PLEO|nr:hypothetical protein K505DRAFT_290765 [Melanomma pulvis-pyrius CBS 109.77]
METASKTERSPEPPVRILVETLTHLVPGNGSYERTYAILHRICQHHWDCDFTVPKFRYATYNCQFAINNRRCFFLVDYGKSQNDDDVPVLYYEWTGETLKPLPRLATDPEIQAKLKEDLPFTRQRSKREKREVPIRRLVKSRLHYEEYIKRSETDYMREHPEDIMWLKAHLRPRLWRTFVAAMNASRSADDPVMKE